MLTINPRALAIRILHDAQQVNSNVKDVVENQLQPYFKQFEDNLHILKRDAINGIAMAKTAEGEIDTYIVMTMENILKLGLMPFTNFIERYDPAAPPKEATLFPCCTKFLAIIPNDDPKRMATFQSDIHRYRLYNQMKGKFESLPFAYIPAAAPVSVDLSKPSYGVIEDPRSFVLNQLYASISHFKLIFPRTFEMISLKRSIYYSVSAVKSINAMRFDYDDYTQFSIDQFVSKMNEIADTWIKKYLAKTDIAINAALPK